MHAVHESLLLRPSRGHLAQQGLQRLRGQRGVIVTQPQRHTKARQSSNLFEARIKEAHADVRILGSVVQLRLPQGPLLPIRDLPSLVQRPPKDCLRQRREVRRPFFQRLQSQRPGAGAQREANQRLRSMRLEAFSSGTRAPRRCRSTVGPKPTCQRHFHSA